ncbi:MAG: glycosyltransferase WbuB [Phycisphaerae bacterium]|jgi:glycosyltransferase involved in cell wall biosynthesis|nr:MAG: glycosyltransferase WbuB [Phycisphaerae bacterium]
MHVLILNQTFYPDVAATAQHMWDLARHLDASGHRVTAITSQSVYGSSERFSQTYQRIRNITIHRVPQTAFGKVHTFGRMADFLSFYVSAFRKMNDLPAPDVILALTSPPMIAVLGHWQKLFRHPPNRRIALVNHVMDLYPDAAVAMGMLQPSRPLTRFLTGLTRRTLQACDAIIALGTDMKDRLMETYLLPVHESRIHVIPPWADQNEIFPTDRDSNPLREELGLKNDFVLLYSGNFGQAHDVETFIRTIRATRSQIGLKWCFSGGGRGIKILQELAPTEGWNHVRFLPYQPREKLNDLLNLADVHLISQSPAYTGIVVPSKLFGILSAGKPAIMVGPTEAEASRILIDSQSGFVIKPGDVETMTHAIQQLRDNPTLRQQMGQRARQTFCERYDCRLSCARIERILHQVVENARCR